MGSQFHLMKWMRKNKNKIMAIVVVLIMGAFIMPQFISQLARPGGRGTTAVAHFGIKGTITNESLNEARSELGLLRILGAPTFLQSRSSMFNQKTPDIAALVLSQLLFPEQRLAPLINEELKRAVHEREGSLQLSDSQIDEFFEEQSMEKPEIYWLLLKAEAKNVGFAASTEEAGEVLKMIVPQMTQGKMTADAMIKQLVESQNIEQQTILRTFADLIAVWRYAGTVTQNEDMTSNQLRYQVAQQFQTMDINAVIVNAMQLTAKAGEPAAEQIQKQFDTYKRYFPNDFGTENPYGFGYKQPARVQVEWAMVELTDVAKQVPQPTSEQVEEYYQRNLSQYKTKAKKDPNDPNSQETEVTQPFAEVAMQISAQLHQSRIAERADLILTEVRDVAEANYAGTDIEKLSEADLAKLAISYANAATGSAAKYQVTIHTSKTGYVTAEDIERNEYFGRLMMQGQGRTPTRLTKIIFAVKGLDVTRLGPFEPAKPRVYESIGPLKDYMGQVAAIVRVTAFEKAHEPSTIDLAIEKKLPTAKAGSIVDSNEVYAVKTSVREDLKKLAAFDIARQAAKSIVDAVPSVGWDKAVAAANKQYGKDSNDTPFKFQPLNGLRRKSEQEVLMAKREAHEDAARSQYAGLVSEQKKLIDRFFSLLPDNQTVATNVPLLVESQGYMQCFVVRSMTRNNVTKEQYERVKAQLAFIDDYSQGQSMSLEYFRPDNILKRSNFKWDDKTRNQPVHPMELPVDD